MIPESTNYFMQNENSDDYQILPTKTYKIDRANRRIIGMIDEKEAVFQYIEKVLNTDKYAWEIYDWYYGNELLKLVGHSYDYICTRIPNIFREALLTDDRIVDVRDFTFTKTSVDSMEVSCVVDTIYGKIDYKQEVLT